MTEEKKPRKIPTSMPTTPEELLAFVAWPEMYENETITEFSERMALCHRLAEQHAHSQAAMQASVAHRSVKEGLPKADPKLSSIILPPWVKK